MNIQIDNAALTRALSVPAQAALEEIGRAEVETIKSDLSVPVVYGDREVSFVTQAGERVSFIAHQQVITRSAPGEPPRMEEGLLRANVSYHVGLEDGVPVLNIVSARPPQSASPRQVMRFSGEVSVVHAQGVSPASVPQILENDLNRPYMGPALQRLSSYATQVFADHYSRNL